MAICMVCPTWKCRCSSRTSFGVSRIWRITSGGKCIIGRHRELGRDVFLRSGALQWGENRLDVRAELLPLERSSDVSHSRNSEPSRDDGFVRLCEEGHLEKALDAISHMEQQGNVPSVNMYRSLLKACSRRKDLAQAKRVHAHLARHGLECRRSLGDYVVSTLVKCGGFADALQVFHRLPPDRKTLVSWNAIISGYNTAGKGQEALRMYHCMREEGVRPDKFTFVGVLKACGSLWDLQEGKRIHDDVLKYRVNQTRLCCCMR